MKVTVLGCGGSGGVPLAGGVPGGDWGSCNPANPRNRRTRVSVLVEEAGKTLLIDTSPDLRQQILNTGLTDLDAVLFTHAHGDHCHGLDDLRWLVGKRGDSLDAYMPAWTRAELCARFSYAFASSADPASLYKPLMRDHAVSGTFLAAGVRVTAFEQDHGPERTFGYRIGDFAYSTDVVRLDEAAFATLEGVQVWVVDCLRLEPHPTHTHLARTLEWIARVKPARAILTHLNHSLDYDKLAALCPPGVEPGFDGLTVEMA